MVDLLTEQMVSVLKTGGEEDWMLLVMAMTWTFLMKQKTYWQLLTAMLNLLQPCSCLCQLGSFPDTSQVCHRGCEMQRTILQCLSPSGPSR